MKRLPVDWDALQQPGFSADYINDRYERMDLAFARSSWTPTEAARALLQYNGPLLAYLAGPPSAFTSQEHNFFPGDVVRKQLILLNNSRRPITCECQWSLRLPAPQEGNRTVTIDTGQQCRIALQFELPDTLPHGSYQLDAVTRFSGAAADSEETPIVQQRDSLTVDVLARPSKSHEPGGIALFDPAGETEMLLKSLGIEYELIDAKSDLSPYDMLVVGKQSLTVDGPAPDIRGVRDGLRVLLFEQTPAVLEQRFGFRVATYGLRWLFERVPEHPILNGLASQHLRNWRGEATIVPPRLDYEIAPDFSGVPTVRWCGISSPRLWRCGNRGNVATVLIEKPHRGDFLPILDGGFSLQYSPLMEYREGKGLVVFCQLDVTGRTDEDPAALIITKNLLEYVATWRPRPRRHVTYAGNQQLKAHLESAGIRIRSFADGELANDDLLAVGRGGWKELAAKKEAVSNWLQAGGRLIAFGLEEETVDSFFPGQFKLRQQEHIGAFFASATVRSPFCGIGPSDVHNAVPCDLPLLSGDEAIGNGVLGMNADGNVIVCQLTPDRFVYGAEQRNVKRTFRRTSFLVSRLLANMGAASDTPLLEQFSESLKGNTAPSLIRNGAFSSGNSRDEPGDHWSFSAQDKQASCKRLKDEGDWLVRLSCPMGESEENATVMLAQAGIPVQAKQWYRISLKARADRWIADQVSVTLMNTSNWRSLFPYQRFVPESSWTTFEFTVQASDTATDKTRFQIWFDGAGTLDLTDVEFVPINNPTSGRWLDGLYLDIPEEWDDPYRFFRW